MRAKPILSGAGRLSGRSLKQDLQVDTPEHDPPQQDALDSYGYFMNYWSWEDHDQVGDGLCGRNFKFMPTQICLSLLPTPASSGVRKVTLKVIGLDQFGAPAVDYVTLTTDGSPGTKYSRQGTKKCFSAYYDIIVEAISGINPNPNDDDLYQIGIGRSIGDDASPPPRPADSFRFPIPYRIRNASSIRGCHDVLNGTVYTAANLTVDVYNQAVEVIVGEGEAIHAETLMNPNIRFF